jgi:hypothetical protein
MTPIEKQALRDRFWGKVEKGPGCWLWTGAKNERGYGSLRVSGATKKATHVAWYLEHGQWPVLGVFACHQCDNPGCVKPSHLFLGSALDNNRDRHRKGRTVSNLDTTSRARGEHTGGAKLTEENVREIRRTAESGVSLARRFGVSPVTISKARRGLKWRHVV